MFAPPLTITMMYFLVKLKTVKTKFKYISKIKDTFNFLGKKIMQFCLGSSGSTTVYLLDCISLSKLKLLVRLFLHKGLRNDMVHLVRMLWYTV